MKTIFKSFRFRIHPNKDQEVLLDKHFCACRFVFNHYLNKRKEQKQVEALSLDEAMKPETHLVSLANA